MNIASLIERRQPGRKVQGIAAALLPYEADGRVAVESFQATLDRNPPGWTDERGQHGHGLCQLPERIRKARRSAMDCVKPWAKTLPSWPEPISKIKLATLSLSTGSRWT